MSIIIYYLLIFIVITYECDNYTTPKCTFIFTSNICTLQYCIINQNTNDTNTTILYLWQNCIISCCNDTTIIDKPYLIDSLNTCSSFNQDESIIPIAIGLSLGILIFITIIYCIYCKFVNQTNTCISRYQSKEEIINQRNRYKVDHDELINQTTLNKKTDSTIAINQGARSGKRIQNCSICLQNDTTVKTFCGHDFHPLCLRQWLGKSKSCPDCRDNALSKFQIFCNSCYKERIIVDYFYLTDEYACKWCK